MRLADAAGDKVTREQLVGQAGLDRIAAAIGRQHLREQPGGEALRIAPVECAAKNALVSCKQRPLAEPAATQLATQPPKRPAGPPRQAIYRQPLTPRNETIPFVRLDRRAGPVEMASSEWT